MKFPEKCPYCGKDIIQHVAARQSAHASSETLYTAELHNCIHCLGPIFVFKSQRIYRETSDPPQILQYFPVSNFISYPERVKVLSPKAFDVYEQTVRAKENGLDTLIGAGLRIALEWLVQDYLLKVKMIPQSDIEHLLVKRIAQMDGIQYSKICAKIVRLFGNDQVHTVKESDFSAEEALFAFETLCGLIEAELQILEMNSRLSN